MDIEVVDGRESNVAKDGKDAKARKCSRKEVSRNIMKDASSTISRRGVSLTMRIYDGTDMVTVRPEKRRENKRKRERKERRMSRGEKESETQRRKVE